MTMDTTIYLVRNVYVVSGTETHLKVRVKEENHWIPQCEIKSQSEVSRVGESGTLVLRRKWAREQGWV